VRERSATVLVCWFYVVHKWNAFLSNTGWNVMCILGTAYVEGGFEVMVEMLMQDFWNTLPCWLLNSLPTFRRTLLSPSSGYESSWLRSTEMPVTVNQMTWYHVLGKFDSWPTTLWEYQILQLNLSFLRNVYETCFMILTPFVLYYVCSWASKIFYYTGWHRRHLIFGVSQQKCSVKWLLRHPVEIGWF
jgi:hypothetical protein